MRNHSFSNQKNNYMQTDRQPDRWGLTTDVHSCSQRSDGASKWGSTGMQTEGAERRSPGPSQSRTRRRRRAEKVARKLSTLSFSLLCSKWVRGHASGAWNSWKIKVKSCRRDVLKRGMCVVHGCVSALGLNLRQRSCQQTIQWSFCALLGFLGRYTRRLDKSCKCSRNWRVSCMRRFIWALEGNVDSQEGGQMMSQTQRVFRTSACWESRRNVSVIDDRLILMTASQRKRVQEREMLTFRVLQLLMRTNLIYKVNEPNVMKRHSCLAVVNRFKMANVKFVCWVLLPVVSLWLHPFITLKVTFIPPQEW